MLAEAALLEMRGASKSFGDVTAVDHVSLAIAPGQLFGFIGPSGSGKTTTVRLMLGMLAPSAGEVEVMGADPRHFSSNQREQIGYMPQAFSLYPSLTVYENLRFVAGLYGMPWRRRRLRIREVLQFLELWDARKRLAQDLSGGMQRRLQMACALVHQPSLLFIDEPTSGLDPILRAKIWDELRALRDNGATLVVTTQLVEESENCDNVGVMSRGRLLAVGSPAALRRKVVGGEVVDVKAQPLTRETLADLRRLPEVKAVRWNDDGNLRIVVEDAASATPAITDTLREHGETVEEVRPVVPDFDEVFRRIIGDG